ncbi:hypothetical protein [Streptomyces sp. JB150]|uniref:hypothetical protein n=1 Tax=Streptomyces sp. JB150 TaxID=2714844 RepID=UPI0014097223|nr:hypothetical protein [Streptomyces sp. JB150]QIJ62227.1 hypothetical protein G7Z13_09350 [Streptomyces sp. JB150]
MTSQHPSEDAQDALQDGQDAAQDARRFVDRHFPAVAAFLASDDARPDADLMRVDAPQVNRCDALDGQCTGQACGENGDPREPIHLGPEHGLNVSFADYPLNPFQLTQWADEQPVLSVYAGGTWPDLTLAQVDELLLAFDRYTGVLRVAREHLARAVAAQDATGDAQDATQDAQDAPEDAQDARGGAR